MKKRRKAVKKAGTDAQPTKAGTSTPLKVDKRTRAYKMSLRPRGPERRETVNHPAHYGGDTTYEAIKVIEAWNLNFRLGNAVKYICRESSKAGLEDLKKAKWYLDREITTREKAAS